MRKVIVAMVLLGGGLSHSEPCGKDQSLCADFLTRRDQQYGVPAHSGYDVGAIDGFLGLKTRQAVKAMQVKYGLPADSFPTAELLARMHTDIIMSDLPAKT
jgi:hypothetical protein